MRHSEGMYPFQNLNQISFTPAEVAKLLKVKISTVYAWISRGELQSNKTGYSRAVSQAQLHTFINSRKSDTYYFAQEHIR
jgi:excisionase family DNA binding protein